MKKIYFKSVGCRVNQVEVQSIREKLMNGVFEETEEVKDADFILINTCSVTHKADRDVFSFIKKASAKNPGARWIVTGCTATLYKGKIKEAAPGALIFGNEEKEDIPSRLLGEKAEKDFFSVSGNKGKTRVFVKLQDGCDRRCAYCVVRKARGVMRSKPFEVALGEIKKLVSTHREVVLCGTRLGAYRCEKSGFGLKELAQKIFELNGSFRIRLSSIEPFEIDEELLKVLKDGGEKFCPCFHVPFQSGCDRVLDAMNRGQNTADYRELISLIGKYFHGAALFGDIIAGYPSESEKDFRETLRFARKSGFAGLHVFAYSPRPLSAAFSLKPLRSRVVAARSKILRDLDGRLRKKYAKSLSGKERKVLILESGEKKSGLTEDFQTVRVANYRRGGDLVKMRLHWTKSELEEETGR